MTNPIHSVANAVSEWLNQPTPRKQMLPAYLILTVGIVLGFARFESLADERAEDLAAQTEANAFVVCVSRVETREALRSVLIGITELFDDNTRDVQAVVALIESDYPPLSVDDCAHPDG
jgi:hypothetical protein